MAEPRKRATNVDVCEDFRAALTHGAAATMDEKTLAATKDYRGTLWKMFREIEDRLCPRPGS